MTKIKNTTELTEKILAPLIKFCAENRGALTRVTELYNKGLSDKVRVTTVSRWLNRDRKHESGSRFKIVEPSGGALLRLCEVWREIREIDIINNPQPTVFCAVNGHAPDHAGHNCKLCSQSL